jgi:hypothetical protein
MTNLELHIAYFNLQKKHKQLQDEYILLLEEEAVRLHNELNDINPEGNKIWAGKLHAVK